MQLIYIQLSTFLWTYFITNRLLVLSSNFLEVECELMAMSFSSSFCAHVMLTRFLGCSNDVKVAINGERLIIEKA